MFNSTRDLNEVLYDACLQDYDDLASSIDGRFSQKGNIFTKSAKSQQIVGHWSLVAGYIRASVPKVGHTNIKYDRPW